MDLGAGRAASESSAQCGLNGIFSMPELPEVETHVQELTPWLQGRRVEDARVTWPKTIAVPDPRSFCRQLRGQIFRSLSRRAKFMLFHLDRDWHLIVHLRMTGTFRMVAEDARPDKHAHVAIRLDNRQELHFLDPRKFGRMWLVRNPEPVLAGLGPEPLSPQFTGRFLERRLSRRQAAIKAALLDQTVAAGVGNIYADEALFRARLHPRRPARRVTARECIRLCRAIRTVLRTGIQLRGSFISTYRPPSGVPGRFQAEHKVFRRTGAPCMHCGTLIERIVVAQRSTHFCPRCQPR